MERFLLASYLGVFGHSRMSASSCSFCMDGVMQFTFSHSRRSVSGMDGCPSFVCSRSTIWVINPKTEFLPCKQGWSYVSLCSACDVMWVVDLLTQNY